MALMRRVFVFGVLLGATGAAGADDRRAEINYMLHCQGCHLPGAAGVEGRVPAMKDFVGWFLHSEEGREFVIRVPGVSQSALDDVQLAELVNWILITDSSQQLPDDFRPYSAAEVGRLRVTPEPVPQKTRKRILGRIAASVPALAQALDDGDTGP
jgi:hypothetical protein